ncbi:hypothetical protein EG327_000639 [Venturia inaequalis]|uniref:Uncharacterized protein n=2 Tax=Venturia inaequalis TaxID=5025 RepID=A0A8H3VP41_VENIN|nr:hypothetical protein EG327_000639 [Venturia inaequalis]
MTPSPRTTPRKPLVVVPLQYTPQKQKRESDDMSDSGSPSKRPKARISASWCKTLEISPDTFQSKTHTIERFKAAMTNEQESNFQWIQGLIQNTESIHIKTKNDSDIAQLQAEVAQQRLELAEQRLRLLTLTPSYNQMILIAQGSLEEWRNQDAGVNFDIKDPTISHPRNRLAHGGNIITSIQAIQRQLLDKGSTLWLSTFRLTYGVEYAIANRLLTHIPEPLVEVVNWRGEATRRTYWQKKVISTKGFMIQEADGLWQTWQIGAEAAITAGTPVPSLNQAVILACRNLVARFTTEDART